MSLPVEWTKHLKSTKEKEDFERTLRSSGVAMLRLKQILLDWEKDLTTRELREDNYSDASWAFKQAHRNGERSRIKKLLDLLKHLEN